MTRPDSRWTKPLGALLLVLALLVGVQACGVDSPVSSDAEVAVPAPSPAEEAPVPDAPVVEPPEEADAPDFRARELTPDEVTREPTFTPFTVAPSIENRREVVEAMEAEYPPLLRNAGIGGTVRVYFFIGADGIVQDVRVDQSSGHEALDRAALDVAKVYRFSPALNGDQRVPVWVSFPITFRTAR